MSSTAQRKSGEANPNPIVQLATLVGIIAVALNVLFYFLSDAYFDDRVKRFGLQELERLSGARVDFAIFTVVVGGAAIAAAAYPRAVAHGIAALAGVASIIAAPFALKIGFVLATVLLLVGFAFEILVRYSRRQSRAAWAYLASLCAVYGVVMLFGAPKVRGLVGVGMWIALIAPGLLGVATAALSLIRADYGKPAEDRTA
jgi:hypothetical protein